jgi:hypothetical protein
MASAVEELTVAKGAAFVVAGFAALLGGGLVCIASTVGVCAAVCVRNACERHEIIVLPPPPFRKRSRSAQPL